MDVQYNFHLRVILAPSDHPWADDMGVRRPIPGNIRALEDGKFSIRFSQPEINRETRLFVYSGKSTTQTFTNPKLRSAGLKSQVPYQ